MSAHEEATWRDLGGIAMLMFIGTFIGAILTLFLGTWLVVFIGLVPGIVLLFIGMYENWGLEVKRYSETGSVGSSSAGLQPVQPDDHPTDPSSEFWRTRK